MSAKSFHPGVFLRELIEWRQVEPRELARDTGIPEAHIIGITRQQESLDEGDSRRLAEYFGNSPRFWMNLQRSFDQRSATGRTTGLAAGRS